MESSAEPESVVEFTGNFLLGVGEEYGIGTSGDGGIAGGIGFEGEPCFVGGECPCMESEGGLDLGLGIDELSLIAEGHRAEAFEAGHVTA